MTAEVKVILECRAESDDENDGSQANKTVPGNADYRRWKISEDGKILKNKFNFLEMNIQFLIRSLFNYQLPDISNCQ